MQNSIVNGCWRFGQRIVGEAGRFVEEHRDVGLVIEHRQFLEVQQSVGALLIVALEIAVDPDKNRRVPPTAQCAPGELEPIR
jgi:hypothetical protein